MRKIFVFLTILIMALNSFCFANTAYITEATNALQKMKIIIGNENGDLMLNNSLTRAEFATIVTRLLVLENTPTPNTTLKFDDVSKDFWGYNAIYKCVDKGYLIGDGDGKFRPNDPIKYEEVLTIMIRILGQDDNLTLWPDDYISKANSIEITKNTDFEVGDFIDRGNSFVIIYNCLDIAIENK